jgi:hypothetical protein
MSVNITVYILAQAPWCIASGGITFYLLHILPLREYKKIGITLSFRGDFRRKHSCEGAKL